MSADPIPAPNAPEPARPDDQSPCINVCTLDPISLVCDGCHRHVDEIVAWPQASAAERRLIVENARRRREESGDERGTS